MSRGRGGDVFRGETSVQMVVQDQRPYRPLCGIVRDELSVHIRPPAFSKGQRDVTIDLAECLDCASVPFLERLIGRRLWLVEKLDTDDVGQTWRVIFQGIEQNFQDVDCVVEIEARGEQTRRKGGTRM